MQFLKSVMELNDKAFEISQRKLEIGENREFRQNIYSSIHKYLLKTKTSLPKLYKEAPNMKLLLISLFFIMSVHLSVFSYHLEGCTH